MKWNIAISIFILAFAEASYGLRIPNTFRRILPKGNGNEIEDSVAMLKKAKTSDIEAGFSK